jgi:hypothetical protein
MMFARIVGLTFFLIFAATAARAELALRPGEELTFRVAWGIFGNAGEIKIRAETEMNDGKRFLVVTTTTSTQGVLRRLFPFQAQAESIYDMGTQRITVHTESSASNKKKTNLALEFDYVNSVMKFTDFMNSAKNKVVPIPPGSPNDLISSLVLTRNWDLKPGEKRDLNVFFEDDLYELTLYALQYEQVKTRMGTFNTLVYEPRMEKTPPKGMFKRGSEVHVWISQDGQRLPVRFEVEFKFGAGIATLIDYQPPPGEAAPAETTTQR